MPTLVRLPAILRQHAGAEASSGGVEVEGTTVGEVLADLDRRFPAVGRRVLDEQGRIRRHVHVYVGDERVRSLGEGVPAGAEVTVLAAVSGGSTGRQ